MVAIAGRPSARRTGDRRTAVLWTTWWTTWWRNPLFGRAVPA